MMSTDRVLRWLVVASVPAASLVVLVSLRRGHVSTAVWFAAIALYGTWLLIRRRLANRRGPRDPNQVRRTALQTMLGFIVFGLTTGTLAIIQAVQTSGGTRVLSVFCAIGLFTITARLIYKTAFSYRRVLFGNMSDDAEDHMEDHHET